MKSEHRMPFGAQRLKDGAVRFRLWAPSAERVDLRLEGPSKRAVLPMQARADGWYECNVQVSSDTHYLFRIDGRISVPDPASRWNPQDVHAASALIDPLAFDWQDKNWRGRPWKEAVIYELHVGSFTPAGNFAAAMEKLPYLAELGVTAIELMPVAEFAGARNWGYDGVLPFAPNASYGSPDDLKRLIQSAHAHGLMVLLDVVYNHFGPEGNYLHCYAADFFNPLHQTPWGAAINFDGGASARIVRDFFVHNALYWIEEFHFDGLRLDAVHAIAGDSQPHIIQQIARALAEGPGQRRPIHLILENDRNEARWLGRDADQQPLIATAQWNDDIHHALHVLLTGERDGYYADYADKPLAHLGRCLAEGFAYQGEASHLRDGAARGEPSVHLPATAFVSFLQNHDQIGNRAFGERINALASPEAVEAAVACLLLAPSIPLLFMGEEFAASTPFLFFCEFGDELGQAVTNGRRAEFSHFARFSDPKARESIPDPNAPKTFARSRLDWRELMLPAHRARRALYKKLLALRRTHIVPRLLGLPPSGSYIAHQRSGLEVHWTLGDGALLHLSANFSDAPIGDVPLTRGRTIYASPQVEDPNLEDHVLQAWSLVWSLEELSFNE